ncbi:MAG TPA: ABC transporter permease [Micromonospora sp.]|nr:ABC transporter permease [Micromonospora sp.]
MPALFRLVGVGGVTAYCALFNWTTPAMFIGTLLVDPLFQLLFFAYLGRQLGVADDRFYIIGHAVLAASVACVFGGTVAVSNERRYGILGHVLLSPRSRTAVFLGRALPYAGNDLLIAAFTLGVGALLLGLRIPPGALPGLAVTLAAGEGLAAALPAIAAEMLVGVAYAALAVVLLKVFEAKSRRHVSLDAL